ncbi:hypothetical protein UlMin_019937 [Ulmus minor]
MSKNKVKQIEIFWFCFTNNSLFPFSLSVLICLVLGVEKSASQQQIKKAYYKLALRLHPDKNPGDEQLQKVIGILGDEEKRAIYDQTGCVDDVDLAGDVVQNLCKFFRAMYKKATEADIEEFEANYRGSDSEKKDLIELYKKLFCLMLCSDTKLDSHRFKDILNEAIAAFEKKIYAREEIDSMRNEWVSYVGSLLKI